VSFVPVIGAWWPHGYAALFNRPDVWPKHPFGISHVVPAWRDSLLFTPRALAVLVPLAVAGVVLVRPLAARVLVAGVVLVNVVFYSFYANTPQHPRFLYVAFPELFTLCASGAVLLGALGRDRLQRRPESAAGLSARGRS